MSKRKKTAEKTTSKSNVMEMLDRYSSWIILVALAVMPLIIRGTRVEFIAPAIVAPPLDTGLQGDFFTYYKWIFLLAAAVIINGLMLGKIWFAKYQIPPSYINILVMGLVILILISSSLADYKSISWIGMYNRHEGALTYLAYLTLFFVAANTVFKPWFAKWSCGSLLFITFINMSIALISFSGHDLTQFAFLKNSILPPTFQGEMQGHIRSMLAHPNYSSGLSAALFVFMLAHVLLEEAWQDRAVYGFGAIAAFVAVLASMSSSGFLTVVLVIPLVIASVWLSSQRKRAIIAGVITLLLCAGLFIVMDTYNPTVGEESLGMVKSLVTGNSELPSIGNEPGAGGTNITPSAVQPPLAQGIEYTQSNDTSLQTSIFNLPSPGWAPGTGRLYIWGQVLELIEARPWLGYGLDTLPYYFPQNDVNKIAGLWDYKTLVDKPHNFYLAVAYGLGIPALLALLALFLLHFYHTGRYLLAAPRGPQLVFPTALYLFFSAYLVQWLFNDSVVGSAQIFWILTGVGVSLNRTLSN